MIDHFGFQAADLDATAAFYDTVLGTLGHRRVMDFGEAIGYGTEAPDFWISRQQTGDGFRESHIAFAGPLRRVRPRSRRQQRRGCLSPSAVTSQAWPYTRSTCSRATSRWSRTIAAR